MPQQVERDDPLEPPDAVEPDAGSPNVQVLVETLKEVMAINARYEAMFAERAAPPITWLSPKEAGYRAGGLSSAWMIKWAERGWVDSRREGRLIFINKASLDARLKRLGRIAR
jgi:hypothetical protein